MSATTKQARAAMKVMGCRPAGDCLCCEGYCNEHWTEFDEDGICPTARKVADAVVESIGPFMRVVKRDRVIEYIDDSPESWVPDEE